MRACCQSSTSFVWIFVWTFFPFEASAMGFITAFAYPCAVLFSSSFSSSTFISKWEEQKQDHLSLWTLNQDFIKKPQSSHSFYHTCSCVASGTYWAVNREDAKWVASIFMICHLLLALFSHRRFANLHPLQTTRRRYATEKPVTTHNELPLRWRGPAKLPGPLGSMQTESMTSSTRATRGSSCRPRICSPMYTSLLEVSFMGSYCFCWFILFCLFLFYISCY